VGKPYTVFGVGGYEVVFVLLGAQGDAGVGKLQANMHGRGPPFP
jgi:hypothetical protein